ncbi:GHKL domain-containing protein [Leptobacterium flavescens]|uniref:GHKL domain-containing protein n=1 Tax=Leptobacterium flavescens TaxID=472055 RepID=A0A6P0UTM8_9FLAO|nr:sensor histidine kinase [Leptobacterium flavescens]NER14203.1 GHKL domain-containing protein [Leptobacterium flavescens]
MSLNPYLKKLNNHNALLFNGVLWSVSFVILLFIFSKGRTPLKIDYIYTLSFLSSLVIPVLINLYILIPRLLKKEKYWWFIFAFAVNLIVFSQLQVLFFEPLIDTLFPDYFFISYHSDTRLITIFSIFLVTTSLIKLSEDWFHFNRNENLELKKKNLHIEAQLSSLRSQINPHFLFNSLNVIYSLAIDGKNETKDAIVQLSDILRYVIYDADAERVTIEDELLLLKNYIEFQKFRVHGFQNIKLKLDIEDDQYKLYPMLLLPLVENSYKHGVKGDPEDTFINIEITQKNEAFSFKIENNNTEQVYDVDNEYSGVGLENIRKNLRIIYPGKHQFDIEDTEDKFTVNLKLH